MNQNNKDLIINLLKTKKLNQGEKHILSEWLKNIRNKEYRKHHPAGRIPPNPDTPHGFWSGYD